MSKNSDEQRIAALEEALLEYIGLYGPTELARKAFQVSAADQRTSVTHDKLDTPENGKPDSPIE